MSKQPDDEDTLTVEPLTEQMLVPREWRCALPGHIERLRVTPRMCATFPTEARQALAEET